jgi:nucleotide-binding universal stress UspA family protein
MQRVLVCIDGSPRQPHVLEAAAGLARRTGARLVLFQSVGLPHGMPVEAWRLSPNDVVRSLEEGARANLTTCERALDPALRGGIKVTIGVPWESICRAAREEDVDLVVLGSHGYDALDRVVGTTAAKVVNHADRAVLVVRAHERLASGARANETPNPS